MAQDEELIRSYRANGSALALNELVSRHVDRIRGLVFSMVLDDAVADDLTQEVFLRTVRGLASFDGRSQFSTWLYRVAMNTVHSYLDRQGRSPVVFGSELSETEAAAVSAEQAVVLTELEQDIETALATLSPKLRAAIVLTCIEGKSTGEAATIEGCTNNTMYGRIHEARKRLKQKLAKHLQ